MNATPRLHPRPGLPAAWMGALLIFVAAFAALPSLAAAGVCTTDTLRITGITAPDEYAFVGIPGHQLVQCIIDLDSDDWDLVPDDLDVRYEILDSATDTVIATNQVTISTIDIELSPSIEGVIEFDTPPSCFPAGLYYWRVTLDPDEVSGDCVPENNTEISSDFVLQIFSTTLVWGGIETTIDSIGYFNPANNFMSCQATWNGTIPINAVDIRVTQGPSCEAVVTFNSASFSLPQPVSPGNWDLLYSNGLLDSTGAHADLNVPLPDGILHKKTAVAVLFSEKPVFIGNVPLNQNFSVSGSWTITDIIELKADIQPFSLLGFSDVQWSDADGFNFTDPTLTYIHADEFVSFPFRRPTNDSFFYHAEGPVPAGGAKVTLGGLEVQIDIPNPGGIILPAFPSGFAAFFSEGNVFIQNNLIQSGQFNTNLTQLRYNTGACFGGPPTDTENFATGVFDVRLEGAVQGALTGTSTHTFNFDAYEVQNISEGDIYFPGYIAVGKSGLAAAPHEYLLAGRDGPGISQNDFAMYGEPAYTIGDGVYGGYNLSQEQLDGESFKVTIACADLNLTFTPYSKLYARYGGFSGTLDGGGSLPANLQLYGKYDTIIERFNISLLDNEQALESHINGQIDLPFPSMIDLPFTSMELDACGDPGKADVANVDRTLAYWNAQFLFAGLEFRPVEPPAMSSCGSEERTLWTTSTNTIPRVDFALLMETNFLGNGDIVGNKLIGEAKNFVDDYSFSIRRVLYSKWDNTMNLNGMAILIGDIKLPFWGATPVKAIVDAGGSSWIFQGRNFAASPPVDDDVNQNGFPDGSGITNLTQYADHTSYYPNVVGSFAKIINLDYPVEYNRLLKQFKSPKTKEMNLVVINVESSVKQITKDTTEVLFGLRYEGLPTLNLSQLVGDYSNAAIQALIGPLKNHLDTAGGILNGNLADLVRQPVGNFVDPYLQTYLAKMQDAVENIPAGPALDAELNTARSALISTVKAPLQNHLRQATGPIQNEAKKVLTALNNLENILDTLDPNVVRQVLVGLIQFTGNDASGVDAVFADVESARQAIRDIIKNQIRPPIQQLLAQINTLNRFSLIDDVLSNAAVFDQMITQIDTAIMQYTNSVKGNKALVRNLTAQGLRDTMINTFFNSILFSQLNTQVTALFGAIKQQITDSVLSFLDVLNNTVNQYLDQIGAGINNVISQMNDVIGVKAAKLNGYAVFSAETLDRLHIGAELDMATPDSVKFTGAIDMERIKHNGTGATCGVPDQGDTIRVSIEIGGIPISFGVGDMTATIGILITLWDNAGDIQVRNFAGSIVCKGSIGFASVAIIDPAFGIGVGKDENYLFVAAKVKLDGVAGKGGFFFGRTCNGLDILKIIDPEVADVIKVTEMFGVFTSAEVAIPILDYGCMLRAGASVGAGFWVFINGPQYGAKLSGGLFGQAACIVSVRGKVTLIGAKDAAGYVLSGTAWVAGGIGFCSPEDWFTPADVFDDDWCATCVAYLNIIYRPKSDWNAKYSIDCSL